MAGGENESSAREPSNRRVFRLGEAVRIRAGAFGGFAGKIEGINQAKALLKVRVEIFGRTTPLRLPFAEVEKIAFIEGRD